MQTQGRRKSQNVIDVRNYFGTPALDPDYHTEDRFRDFLAQALGQPQPVMTPQQFDSQGIMMGLPQQFIRRQ
jgi:hypothetical protein